jgi:iron complex outermembrane receptor protein
MGIRGILLAGSALGLAWAGQAAAQPAQDGTSSATPPKTTAQAPTAQRAKTAAAKGGAVVEELVVTAHPGQVDQLRDAPVAATTYVAEQRNLVAANTLTDMVNLTPGVTISANGINIRGVGRETNETGTLGSTPGVAYYVNGFYKVVAGDVGESTLYSESVQFERGPQGTRFGRETIGGTVSLYARHPTSDFRGEAVAQYGSRGFWGAGVNVAGPLNDRYGIRLGYQHFDASDPVSNNLGPVKAGGLVRNDYFEFQLEGRPTDKFHFWLRSTTFAYNDPAFYGAVPGYTNTTGTMLSLAPNPHYGLTQAAPTGRDINVDERGIDRLRNNEVHILNADYDFGAVKLYYVGGYEGYKATGNSDYDQASRSGYTICNPGTGITCDPGTLPFAGAPNGLFVSTYLSQDYNNNVHYYTHELRLENTDKSHVDWVVGGFYYPHWFDYFYEQTDPNQPELATPTLTFAPFAFAAPNPTRAFYQQHNTFHTVSKALFGDIIFHLNPSIDVYGGLRYSDETGHATTSIRYVIFNPTYGALDVTPGTPFGLATPSGTDLSYHNTAWTGRAGLDYHLTDDAMVYVKYSRGFKPSAFRVDNVTSVATNLAAPETLNAYEAGWKQRFSPTFYADATIYYYDYRNLQIPLTIIDPITHNPGSEYTNIAKTRSYGLELQGTWTPTPSFWLNASYSYLNAKVLHSNLAVDAYNPATVGGVSIVGNRLPFAPEHKLSLAATYTWNLTPGSLILGGNAAYLSSQQVDVFENPLLRLPSNTLVNASLTFRTADNHYDFVVQASNLFDRNYVTSIVPFTFGGLSRNLGAPQFVQATVRYRW